MKRDLKKWLNSKEVQDYLLLMEEHGYDEEEICKQLLNGNGPESIVQFIWCAAQKQFLKNILDDIDDCIEKIFNGKDNVKNDKARIVAEESNLKAWLYNKYKYLQRKNGK